MPENQNYYEKLRSVPVRDKFEKKGQLDYLNWAKAWDIVKMKHPKSTYKINRDPQTGYKYFTNHNSGWVETEVTVDEVTLPCDLAIMDNRNQPIPKDKITSVDVMNTQMRALTKNCALHGVGINAWTGEKDYITSDDFDKALKTCNKEKAAKIYRGFELTIEQAEKLTNKFKNKENVESTK